MKRGQIVLSVCIVMFLIVTLFISGCGKPNLNFSASNSGGICQDKLGKLETYLGEAGYNLSNAEPTLYLTWDEGKVGKNGRQICEYASIGNRFHDNASSAMITYSWTKNSDSDNVRGRGAACQNRADIDLLPNLDYHETLPFGDPSFVGYKINEFYVNGVYSDQLVLFIFKGDQCYQVVTSYVNAHADMGKLKDVGLKLGKSLGW